MGGESLGDVWERHDPFVLVCVLGAKIAPKLSAPSRFPGIYSANLSGSVGQTYQIAAQAGYPMVTLPAGVSPDTGMPFGLALMGTAWSESTLIKYASAIEDLQLSSETKYKRTSPLWLDYRSKNVPVNNV
jgi:Asp-tRNA(Asn)/Glu-tRNA(Gln) amidotransferase A subunit family amidase